MKDILDTYGRASRQIINFQKSEVFFNSNTTPNLRQNITSFLGVTQSIGRGKYLGPPSIIDRNKKISWILA